MRCVTGRRSTTGTAPTNSKPRRRRRGCVPNRPSNPKKWKPPIAPPPGFDKTQSLTALSMLRLVTEGDLPEEDWKLLHAQDKQGFSYEEFKTRMKKAAPAFAHYIEHEYKAPPGPIPD